MGRPANSSESARAGKAGTGSDGTTLRARSAIRATLVANALSRRLGLGSGTVAGGRLGLALDPSLLGSLSVGRTTALVSGTNGKTTTTRLLAAALGADSIGVVTNTTGSNMPAGLLASLAAGPLGSPIVFEVDEAYVPQVAAEVHPAAIVLLNLSRDQLDRTNEVRMLAARWRAAMTATEAVVVANADDPLVVWSANGAATVHWVGAGISWRNDAVGCPSCGERVAFDDVGPGWRCTACALVRPPTEVWIDRDGEGGPVAIHQDGRRLRVGGQLPGRFNVANAVMAAVAAEALGRPMDRSMAAMAEVTEVAGRFAVRHIDGVPTRLLLAKNPAGWTELLDLVQTGTEPVVVAINARTADGKDPSWLWDVPFESLAGRTVVATGDRYRDLSVRLHYAGVAHQAVRDPVAALVAAAAVDAGVDGAPAAAPVQFVGNYTAFHDLLTAANRQHRSRGRR